ncbi:MAG TPA: ferritin-like domain-containing protein [Nitrospira sp.]|nr:ferritin-like domain-containing protein [Nitrospira sp.]
MNERIETLISAAKAHNEETNTGRRRFIGQSALLASLAVAGGLPLSGLANVSQMSSGGSDLGILNTALGLEHEGIAAYQIAAESGLLRAQVLAVGVLFQGHHKGHRDELARLIQLAGGRPVEPKSQSDYARAINASTLKSQEDILRLAVKLERGAANAYIGSIAALHDLKLAQLFARLGADEATHWTVLNNAIGEAIPRQALIFG